MTSEFPINEFQSRNTPFYYYDINLLRHTLNAIMQASDFPGYKVHYAVKANVNPVVLSEINTYGLGADTVSGGEIMAVLEAGFPAEKIVFAGVGKRDDEIRLALEVGIGCFNVESAAELDVIEEIARDMDKCAKIALRVNPNIDAHTHHYITTGLSENKFGIDMAMLEPLIKRSQSSSALDLRGLHFHIGSQITTMEPYRVLCERINAIQDKYEADGITFASINVGGGLGVDYDNPSENPIPDFKAYFDTFRNNLCLRPGQELHFELGRAVVAQCGSLISKVLYVKEGIGKKFVILDAGFTELIRPALYQAHHKIENITSTYSKEEVYDVVGPICESSDRFGDNERMPVTCRGDLVALRSAGAYGEIMASQYNCRPLPKSFYKY